jgi:hypothetical protein
VAKLPPAYKSLPDTASADTVLFIPTPSADQLLPFQPAIRPAATGTPTLFVAMVKSPPA